MSHFTRIQTRFVDRTALLQAFSDLGLTVSDVPGPVRGYGANSTMADMRVDVGHTYDIGISNGPDGFELNADWDMIRVRRFLPDNFLAQLKQRYAYQVTRSKLQEQGFAMVEEQNQQDGSLHLVMRRTS